jgi:hypothetical protein
MSSSAAAHLEVDPMCGEARKLPPAAVIVRHTVADPDRKHIVTTSARAQSMWQTYTNSV